MKDYSRKPRTYKASDEVYNAAMKRAKREKVKLANIVEKAIWDYASGHWETIFEYSGEENPTKLKKNN